MNEVALRIDFRGTNSNMGLIDHEKNCIYKSSCKRTFFDLPEELAKVIFEYTRSWSFSLK